MDTSRIQVGRIFQHKENKSRWVRIDRLFDSLDEPPVPAVSYAIWDMSEQSYKQRWSVSSALSRDMFEARYNYSPHFFENRVIEMAEATTMRKNLQEVVEAALKAAGVREAEGAQKLADLFVRLVQNEAAQRIYTHDGFDECIEGCEGSTTDEAAGLIEVEITEAEREELLSE